MGGHSHGSPKYIHDFPLHLPETLMIMQFPHISQMIFSSVKWAKKLRFWGGLIPDLCNISRSESVKGERASRIRTGFLCGGAAILMPSLPKYCCSFSHGVLVQSTSRALGERNVWQEVAQGPSTEPGDTEAPAWGSRAHWPGQGHLPRLIAGRLRDSSLGLKSADLCRLPSTRKFP